LEAIFMKRKRIALLLCAALLAGVFSVNAAAAVSPPADAASTAAKNPALRSATDIFLYSPDATRWLQAGLDNGNPLVHGGCAILYCLLWPGAKIVHWFRGLFQRADPNDLFLLVSDARSRFSPANQDGNIAIGRDKNGGLWAITGHTAGNGPVKEPLVIYKGTTVDNLTRQYDARLNFVTGNAGEAFNGTRYYPGGPYARGAVWPMGLYIDDNGKWWAYCHNETAWHISDGSWYNVYGVQEGEPDYRTMCVISSADDGRTWDFVGWALVPKEAMYSDQYVPPEVEDPGDMQLGPNYQTGEGDACVYINDTDGYIYVFFTRAGGEICVARAPKDHPAALKKYYNGAWESPGVKGEATPLLSGGKVAIPTVAYSTYLNKYVMFAYDISVFWGSTGNCPAAYCVSDDMLNWSAPRLLATPPAIPRNAYFSIYSTSALGNPKQIGKDFVLFHNLWAGPVNRMEVTTARLD
jgi:hypothetical protein